MPVAQIDLWLVDMDQRLGELARFEGALSNEERSKRVGIRMERVRNHSILSRGILRSVLASYVGCDAQEVGIEVEQMGRPYLSDKHTAAVGNEFQFNVSHSEGLLAIAVNRSGPIGVDVEKVRKMDQMESIAASLFSADQQSALNSLRAEERLELFFKYWVHRESVTKALGVGLLENVEIEYQAPKVSGSWPANATSDELITRICVSKLAGSKTEWSLYEFTPRASYIGSIALSRQEYTLRTRWF